MQKEKLFQCDNVKGTINAGNQIHIVFVFKLENIDRLIVNSYIIICQKCPIYLFNQISFNSNTYGLTAAYNNNSQSIYLYTQFFKSINQSDFQAQFCIFNIQQLIRMQRIGQYFQAQDLKKEDQQNNHIDGIAKQKLMQQPVYTQLYKIKQYSQYILTNNQQQKNHLQTIQNLIKNCEQSDKKVKGSIVPLQNYLNSYHQIEKGKIQQKLFGINLLNSDKQQLRQNSSTVNKSRFRKATSFVTQLLILNRQTSKHCEVVDLTVQLLNYVTTIRILNQIDKKQDHLHQFYQKKPAPGVNAQIFIIKQQTHDYAIKCFSLLNNKLQMLNDSQKVKILINVLTQYFFILLFSELQVGPKVKHIVGFNIVLSKYCIQFSTEACKELIIQNQVGLFQMKQNLKIMHALKIVHQDIKPDNCMYSPYHNKLVFIDFGCCRVLNQSIGLKSITSYVGTINYSSQEMNKTMNDTKKYVDLYYNDLYSLSKTIQAKYNKIKQVIPLKEVKIVYSKFKPQIDHQDRKFLILLKKLKFHIYQGNQTMYIKLWRQIKIMYFEQVPMGLKQIQNFLNQLISNEKVRRIKQKLPQLRKYQKPQKTNANETERLYMKQLLHNLKCPAKQQLFQQQLKLYILIELQYGKVTIQQKKYYFTLMYHKQVEVYLNYSKMSLNSSKFDPSKKFITQYCFIIRNYCSLHHNNYKIQTSQKNRVCSQAISLLKNKNINVYEKKFFQCQFIEVKQIAIFIQFFITQIWKDLQNQFKIQSMQFALINLCLLGYPFDLLFQRNILISFFILQNQTQLKQIYYYWKCIDILVCYSPKFVTKIKCPQQYNQSYANQQNDQILNKFSSQIYSKHKNVQNLYPQIHYFFQYLNKQQIKLKSFENNVQKLCDRYKQLTQQQIKNENEVVITQILQLIIIFISKQQPLNLSKKLRNKCFFIKKAQIIKSKNYNDNTKQFKLFFYLFSFITQWKHFCQIKPVFLQIIQIISCPSICSIYFKRLYLLDAIYEQKIQKIRQLIRSQVQQQTSIQNQYAFCMFLRFLYNHIYHLIDKKNQGQILHIIKQNMYNGLSKISSLLQKSIKPLAQQDLKYNLFIMLQICIITSGYCKDEIYYHFDKLERSYPIHHVHQIIQYLNKNPKQKIADRQKILQIFLIQDSLIIIKSRMISFFQQILLKNILCRQMIFKAKLRFAYLNNYLDIRICCKPQYNLDMLEDFNYQKYPQLYQSHIWNKSASLTDVLIIRLYFLYQTLRNFNQGLYFQPINNIYLNFIQQLLQNSQRNMGFTSENDLQLPFKLMIKKNTKYSQIQIFFIRLTNYWKNFQLIVQRTIYFKYFSNFNYNFQSNKHQRCQRKVGLIQYLANNIHLINHQKNANMALIYFFCYLNPQLQNKLKNKFQAFICRAFPYIRLQFGKNILAQMYLNQIKPTLQLNHSIFPIQQLVKKLNQIELMNIICKKHIDNQSMIRKKMETSPKQRRKNLYFIQKYLKNKNPAHFSNTKLLFIWAHLFYRKFLYINWNLPKYIFNKYYVKLKRYHYLKDNYSSIKISQFL